MDDFKDKAEIFETKMIKLIANTQMIEEVLRIYLEKSFKIIRKKLGAYGFFGYEWKDVENMPIGNLVRLFRKYCSDNELILRLVNLPHRRNKWAHKGYLILFYQEFSKEKENINQIITDIEDDIQLTEKILNDLSKRMREKEELESLVNDC